jgi:hypothetical protein
MIPGKLLGTRYFHYEMASSIISSYLSTAPPVENLSSLIASTFNIPIAGNEEALRLTALGLLKNLPKTTKKPRNINAQQIDDEDLRVFVMKKYMADCLHAHYASLQY